MTLKVADMSGSVTTKKYTPDSYMEVTNDYLTPVVASSSIKTIDASARTTAVEITAGSSTTNVIGGKGADSINLAKVNGPVTVTAGAGNDTITGGSGAVTYNFEKGAGNDVITNYKDGDSIVLSGATITTAKTGRSNGTKLAEDGSDYLITSSYGTILLQGAGGKTITPSTSSSKRAGFAEELDDELFNSTNFATSADDGLDSIMNVDSSNSYSTEELYNTSVDATSLSKITASVVNKKSNNQ